MLFDIDNFLQFLMKFFNAERLPERNRINFSKYKDFFKYDYSKINI